MGLRAQVGAMQQREVDLVQPGDGGAQSGGDQADGGAHDATDQDQRRLGVAHPAPHLGQPEPQAAQAAAQEGFAHQARGLRHGDGHSPAGQARETLAAPFDA